MANHSIHNPRRTRNTKQYTSRHGWIKLDDPSKPPQEAVDQFVLVVVKSNGLNNRTIHKAVYSNRFERWVITGPVDIDWGRVTHWQPLPALPEEE